MKRDDAPELLLQIGKSKVLAKGLDAINAVKWPLRFLIMTMGIAILALASFGYMYGVPMALRLAKLF
jgi:hypothetical protein